jgi:hypothetical protein
MFLRLASHYREAFSMMGGGWLRCDRYHTRNVCQDVILAQDLIERASIRIYTMSPGLYRTVKVAN